jgi:hypothetical protein
MGAAMRPAARRRSSPLLPIPLCHRVLPACSSTGRRAVWNATLTIPLSPGFDMPEKGYPSAWVGSQCGGRY